MSPYKLSFVLACLAVAFTSCVKDEVQIENSDFGLHPEFGVPLAQAHIQASRVIDNFDENGYVITGEDGVLSLIYRDTLPDFSANELLDLPPQEYHADIDLSELEFVSGTDFGSITISHEEVFSFHSPQGDLLDSIRFESGNFQLNLSSTGNYPVEGTLRVYGEGDVLLFTANFVDQMAPIEIENDNDMENLLFMPINNDNVVNGLKFVYELTFSDQNNGVVGEMDIDVNLSGFSILHAGGYIAPRNYTIADQAVNIDIFDQETSGHVSIADPRLHLFFTNGFGLALGVQIEKLTAYNTGGQTLLIQDPQIDDFPIIDGALFLGDVIESAVSMTNDNITPSLTEIMDFEPNRISADLSLAVNADDRQSVFVSSQSELGINFEAEIPIYGSISDFQLIDTTDVSLGDFVEDARETAEIESLDLRLFVNNGLPLDAGVQIVFTDDDFNAVDSLFLVPDLIFSSAPIELGVSPSNPNYGTSIGMTSTLTVVSISQDRIPNLENATNMIIRVFGHTAGNGDHPIRLKESDAFDIHLSGKTKLSL